MADDLAAFALVGIEDEGRHAIDIEREAVGFEVSAVVWRELWQFGIVWLACAAQTAFRADAGRVTAGTEIFVTCEITGFVAFKRAEQLESVCAIEDAFAPFVDCFFRDDDSA